MTSRTERAQDIFAEALDLPTERRDAFLEKRCADDSELRRAVQDLLDADEAAGSFLENCRRPELPTELLLAPGKLLGDRFRIVRLVGVGGMGEVYEADDVQLGGRVALKRIRPDLVSDPDALRRFRSEIRYAKKVTHPNVCRIYDIGTHLESGSTVVFLTMELLAGRTLAHELRERGRLSPAEALPIVLQLCDALSAAHRAGVVHRDLKPSNTILETAADGSTKAVVTDFGLARSISSEQSAESAPEDGRILGTLPYTAPEQLTGKGVSPATDIYALGLLMFEMLTGRRPFEADTPVDAAMKRISQPPPSPRTIVPDLDSRWEQVILRCLEADPAKRYANADEVACALVGQWSSFRNPTEQFESLEHLLRKSGSGRRRQGALIAAVTIVGALFGVWWYGSEPPGPSPQARHWMDVGTAAMRDGVYWKAVKALQRAVSLDPSVREPHVRLAEAWNEVQCPDKAREEMLVAEKPTGGRSRQSPVDKLYVAALHLTLSGDYHSAVARYEEIVRRLPEADAPFGYVELGRAYEKAGQSGKALESYRRAAKQAPSYPGAFLRLGILNAERLNVAEAEKGLQAAEALYRDQSDQEGMAEVDFQRGRMFVRMDRPQEARASLLRALQSATAAGGTYQEIRILLQLSVACYRDGQTAQATEYATRAIDTARQNGMEPLAISGLIELASGLFHSGEYGRAESYYREAIAIARRRKADFQENAALLSLGSMLIQTRRIDEGLLDVRQAHKYFEQNAYGPEAAKASIVIGRAERDRGDFDAAFAAFRQATAGSDRAQVAAAREAMGSLYGTLENYPAAVVELSAALAARRTLGSKMMIGYAAMNLGSALAVLGQHEAASALFDEASGIQPNLRPLQQRIGIERAEAALYQKKYSEAARLSAAFLRTADPADSDTIDATRILGLAKAMQRDRSGATLCERAAAASASGAEAQRLDARLALVQAQLALGDTPPVLASAQPLAEGLARVPRKSSEWRCLAFAARANAVSGNRAKARDLAVRAEQVLADLRRSWGDSFLGYAARPDIKAEQIELAGLQRQLTAGP